MPKNFSFKPFYGRPAITRSVPQLADSWLATARSSKIKFNFLFFLSQSIPYFHKSNFYLFQLDNIYLLLHNQNYTKIYSFHILWNPLSKQLNKLDKKNI
ncbi:hypothetical protein BpHYR1_053404 [Brachionus plicatilis]|uniref:Uncharacterized protein n=1 Tax=Brachionus plicatilis TaxID=10195 RepID=A0A3M7QHC9_BRAPC|nr:hypothetical protein BpHYR1_053404 [Brachionus plicatilis]